MKTATKPISLVTRLATLIAVLLFSQHAMAVGTPAGTPITNTASVDYTVGGIGQTAVVSAPTSFLVDNRVDFTLVESGLIGPTTVTPGQLDAVTMFTLENTGNQTQDYRLIPTNLGTVNANMSNLRAYWDADNNGIWDPVLELQDFVDELAANGIVNVFIVADAADVPAMLDTEIADVNLEASTHISVPADGILGGVTLATVGGDTAAEDTVLAVGGVNGVGNNNAQDSYLAEVVTLVITKIDTLISDEFNVGAAAYAIPGAIVEYLITVNNPSLTSDATGVSISDLLTNVTFNPDTFGAGDDIEVINNAVTLAACVADDADADLDGCELDDGTNTVIVGNANLLLTVVANTSMTIRFQVTID